LKIPNVPTCIAPTGKREVHEEQEKEAAPLGKTRKTLERLLRGLEGILGRQCELPYLPHPE
jgi:hypothetical protein